MNVRTSIEIECKPESKEKCFEILEFHGVPRHLLEGVFDTAAGTLHAMRSDWSLKWDRGGDTWTLNFSGRSEE